MHNSDDQFEAYLRKFRPVVPDPLPTVEYSRESRRSWKLAVSILAVASMVLVGVFLLKVRTPQTMVPVISQVVSGEAGPPSGPLTQQKANEWLARASSFTTAVDDLAFRNQTNSIQPGKQSAVAVLSKRWTQL